MHRFPRQTNVSEAAQSSSDVTAPSSSGTGSVDATGSQTTISPTTTAATSTSSLSTTPVSSTSADHTTTSSSAETTSTSPSSSSTSSTSVSSAASDTTTASSSSTASQTTPSASSFVPPTTTEPSTSSSSQQGTTTTITSAYTTYVNGSQILTSTPIPSTIPESVSTITSSNRSAIIAGSAAGGTALILLILTLAFCVRRNRFKRLNFLDAIVLKRRQARSRATLLDGEVLDTGLPPHQYTDYDTPWDGPRIVPGASPTTSRRSDTGSAFREDVWPPPHEETRLMDPLANRDDLGLSRIVDDVMGPSPVVGHYSDQSVSSTYRGSMAGSDGLHSRTASNASNAALLEAAGLGAPGPTPNAPVRPSPLAQQGTGPESDEHGDEYLVRTAI